MSGITELFNTPAGKELINGVARETGQPSDRTADVLGMALPLLMGAMKKNVQNPQGAEGLMNALSSRHTGNILGSRQPVVENELSKRTGLSAADIAEMLKIAAPVIMGLLGRQRAQANISDSSGLNTLLGSMLGGQPKQNQDLITSLIDSDGDGSVLDDVAGMVLGGGSSSKGGLGDLLGGMFGK